MITEIVFFKLPTDITREQLLQKYRGTAQKWAKNTDLARKYYFFDPDATYGGGVYVWKDMQAALRWHGQEYKDMIKEIYGSEPEIRYLETLIHVDNEAGIITEY
jgi:hypothetical protein